VRLKGKSFSLKRSRRFDLPGKQPRGGWLPNTSRHWRPSTSVAIRADYMRQFKEYLDDEGLPANEDRIEFVLPVVKNLGGAKLKNPATGWG
jgi:hypothetical protein